MDWQVLHFRLDANFVKTRTYRTDTSSLILMQELRDFRNGPFQALNVCALKHKF